MEIFISRGGRGDGTIFQGEKEKNVPKFLIHPLFIAQYKVSCNSSLTLIPYPGTISVRKILFTFLRAEIVARKF